MLVWNYVGIDEQALIDFENARRKWLGLPEEELPHKHYFELYVEVESKDSGFEVIHILATCKCGKELDSTEIQNRINHV